MSSLGRGSRRAALAVTALLAVCAVVSCLANPVTGFQGYYGIKSVPVPRGTYDDHMGAQNEITHRFRGYTVAIPSQDMATFYTQSIEQAGWRVITTFPMFDGGTCVYLEKWRVLKATVLVLPWSDPGGEPETRVRITVPPTNSFCDSRPS